MLLFPSSSLVRQNSSARLTASSALARLLQLLLRLKGVFVSKACRSPRRCASLQVSVALVVVPSLKRLRFLLVSFDLPHLKTSSVPVRTSLHSLTRRCLSRSTPRQASLTNSSRPMRRRQRAASSSRRSSPQEQRWRALSVGLFAQLSQFLMLWSVQHLNFHSLHQK